MKIQDIISHLNHWAPPAYQESYDNATLITGDPNWEVSGVLISLDCTEEVVDEAIAKGNNLIVAHHPIVFKGLKSFTGKNYVERTVIKAIKADIAIFSMHTNLDNVDTGVSKMICAKLSLQQCKILAPKHGILSKITTFIPVKDAQNVIKSMHDAGAGELGNYDQVSFQHTGTGTFRPNDLASPSIGKANQVEEVEEIRVEAIFPSYLKGKVINALMSSHPYEEVAHFITQLDNEHPTVGSGMIGQLEQPIATSEFMKQLKTTFNLSCIRHTPFHTEHIQKVAVCGGAGSFLLSHAIGQQADIFITGDFKYHEFFDADKKTIIADIGHYESEVFTKELICNFLKEKITNIALNLSEVDTNPIKYF